MLLITADTLRADHLGIYGYARDTSPNLDRFFASGRVIEHGYSTEANTSPSVVSILTGLLPQEHGVRLFFQLVPDDVRLLPELLPASYQSAAFVANIVLTDDAMGMADRFDHYDDAIDERLSGGLTTLYERNAARTTDAALEWLARSRDADRPLVLWVHYIDPHGPYDAPEGAPKDFEHAETPLPIDSRRLTPVVQASGIRDGLEHVDRYDEEIAYLDVQVGRLLDGYAKLAPIDDALVIFTADHGESMMEHEVWFSHGYHVYDEIVRVPLMLRGPGVTPGRVEGPASGIDILPTVIGFAGEGMPIEPGGIDLRTGDPGRGGSRLVFAEATSPFARLTPGEPPFEVGQWRAVVQGRKKWILGTGYLTDDVIESLHFDLALDPGELAGNQPATAAEPERRLRELIAADPDPGGIPAEFEKGIVIDAPKVSPRATNEQREQLRALGYVE